MLPPRGVKDKNLIKTLQGNNLLSPRGRRKLLPRGGNLKLS